MGWKCVIQIYLDTYVLIIIAIKSGILDLQIFVFVNFYMARIGIVYQIIVYYLFGFEVIFYGCVFFV